MVSSVSKQKPIWYICLDLLGFCFSLSSFPGWSTWSSPLWPSPSSWPSSSFTTWIGLPYLIHTLRSKVSPRVSSIIQNQTRAFNVFLDVDQCKLAVTDHAILHDHAFHTLQKDKTRFRVIYKRAEQGCKWSFFCIYKQEIHWLQGKWWLFGAFCCKRTYSDDLFLYFFCVD